MRVTSNTAISLDGRINTREGRFTTLGSARDHQRMSLLRSQADAVLIGGGTFRNWPHPSLPGDEHSAPGAPPVWNVIVSRGLNLPLSEEFLGEPRIRPLLLVPRAALPAGFVAPARLTVEAYDGGGEASGRSLPVPWIVRTLAARGISNLLVEAGGDLLFQFLAADALDELNVTLCPLVIGGDTPSLADGPGFLFGEMRRLALLSAEVEGDEIFLRYRVRRAAPRP
jgi:5-amino-6-(5-phosphoribosylamino)uracil reductase